MPKSRGRKSRRTTNQRRGRRTATPSGWGDMEPWARAMVMADEAEARGDALGTLEIMEAFAAGPDGELFWRPWRAKHLMQIAMLGPILPGWVTSRWICNQALQSLHEGSRDRGRRAFDLAVELRGGPANLPGRDVADAHGRVVDRDWVYRQQFLYELGGLEFFSRRQASSLLLAAADSVDEWAHTPMGGYRLVGSTSDTVTWLDLASDQERSVPNVGSACLVVPGEHAIGRLVPIEGGHMFETQPLVLSAEVAHRVAGDPSDWFHILRDAPASHEELASRQARFPTLITDVPTVVWELAILHDVDPPEEVDDWAPLVTRKVLDVAAREVASPTCRRQEGEVDSWSCLSAALLEPTVVTTLRDVARPSDRQTLEQLSLLLAEPAASLCRDAVRVLFDAA